MLDNQHEKETGKNQVWGIVIASMAVLAMMQMWMPGSTPPAPAATTPGAAAPAPLAAETPREGESAPATPAAPPNASALALPPVAQTADPAVDEITLSHGRLELVFTRVGARLKSAKIQLDQLGEDRQQLVPVWKDTPDADAVYPLGLRFSKDFLGDELDKRTWEASPGEDKRSVVFTLTIPQVAKVEKRFTLSDTDYVVDVGVSYTNLAAQPQTLGADTKDPAYSLNWGPNVNSGDADKYTPQEVTWHSDGALLRQPTSKLAMPTTPALAYSDQKDKTDWWAITSCYFVVGMRSETPESKAWVLGVPQHFRVGTGIPRFEVNAGASDLRNFKVYLGPRQGSALQPAWDGLDVILKQFTVFGLVPLAAFMNWFALTMLNMMNWFHASVYPSYGLSIVFVTIVVRMVTYPLTLKSMRSMKKMQKLAPEMEELKKECGDDQQELQRRMMQLYKERGVSPMGGCFPIFLQFPVFVAFYSMLANAFELRNASFLWIHDLSNADHLYRLPFSIPYVDHINLLPILMGIAMVASTKLTPTTAAPMQDPTQKMMMNIMPVFFSAICYNMAAGLNLYILVSTVFGIAQNYFTHFSDEQLDVRPSKEASKAKRPRHFYNAAQQRKREMAKELRRDKQSKDARTSSKEPPQK